MSTRVRASTGLVLLVGAAALGGCGNDEPARPQEKPLSEAQASLIAGSLDENRRAGGAEFQATTVDAPGGSTITLKGQTDWRKGTGHATVTSSSGPNGVTEVGWSPKVVIEYRPGLREQVARAQKGAVVIARAPDEKRRRLDQVIAVVGGLAAKRRDNPLLVAQKPGSAFLRSATIRGHRVEVLRYGRHTTLWIDPRTRRIVRLETVGPGRVPTVVDLFETGPQDVPGPNPAAVVPASKLRPSYAELAPTSP